MSTARNELLVQQEMDKRARIKKEFLANAEDFNNLKYSLEKLPEGNTQAYTLTSLSKGDWSFKITEDGIEQLSERPDSSSEYWAHAFMEAWMMFPKNYGKGGK